MQSLLSQRTLEAEALSRELQFEKERALGLENQVSQLKEELVRVGQQLRLQSEETQSLTQKLAAKEKALKRLESTGRESSSEAEQLRENCKELRNEIAAQIKAMSLLTQEIATLRSEYSALEDTAAEAQSSNKQLLSDISRLREALDQAQRQASDEKLDLQLTIQKQESIVADLQDKFSSVSDQLEHQRSQTRTASERIVEIEGELELANQDADKNKDIIRLLTEERDSLASQFKASQIKVNELSAQIHALQIENQQLALKLDKKSRDHDELAASLKLMEFQLSNKTLEAEKLNILLAFEQRKNAELTQALSTAKEEIVELKLTIDDLSSQLETAARKLHLAEDTTGVIRSELLALHSELESNQGRQREISMELRRSKGQNRSLTSELEALKAHHNNLKERQEDLLLTLESRERENGILREHIHGLREQNYRLITDHKQLLDEHAELRGELNVQRFTVLRLTEESEKLRGIVSDQELEIFGLNALIAQRDHQIQELERRCHALQQGFREQLAQSVSIHDFEMLEDELAANQRILALTNDHVTDLEAENARLRALLASGGSLPQETGMSNDRRQLPGKKAPTKARSWEETHRNLRDEEENRDDEEVTVRKMHSLELEEADDTTLPDEEGYTTEESEFDEDASGGNRGRNRGNDQRHLYPPRGNRDRDHYYDPRNLRDPRGNRDRDHDYDPSDLGDPRGNRDRDRDYDPSDLRDPRRNRDRDRDYDPSDLRDPRRNRDRDHYYDPRNLSDPRGNRDRDHDYDDEDDLYRGHGLYGRRRRGHRHDEEYSETDDHRHRGPLPPIDTRTGTHSPSSILRGDLPAMNSSATRAAATIALPRTIQDVHSDINLAIGDPNPNYTTGIIGTRPAAATPDTRYVRLASVNPAAPTHPARKLLDADLDKVTVYRRFTESAISPTEKAKVILSSMGIPPDKTKGFELPTELVINNSADPNDPIFNEDGRNNNSVAIIKEMFRIYNGYVEEEELAARSGPSTPGSGTI